MSFLSDILSNINFELIAQLSMLAMIGCPSRGSRILLRSAPMRRPLPAAGMSK